VFGNNQAFPLGGLLQSSPFSLSKQHPILALGQQQTPFLPQAKPTGHNLLDFSKLMAF
jgi:hypothetical protein